MVTPAAAPMFWGEVNRRALLLAPVALALALWPARARPQADDDLTSARARFEGRWRLAVSEAQASRTIDAAVAQAADAMPFYARGIARDRLRDGTPLIRRIELAFDESGDLTVSFDGRRYETPVGRTVVRTRHSDGERMRVTQRLRPSGQLEQVFQTGGGTRWYVYTSTGEGTLRMESTTNSDRMPQPMAFTLDYRRE